MSIPGYVTISDVTVKRETKEAILIEVDEEEYWIPKSQIHDDSEVYRDGDEGDIIISEWIASKKRIE